MYIREYMNTEVITITEDKSISEAQKQMAYHGIRRLPVVEGDKLIGIVTEDKIREVTAPAVASREAWEKNFIVRQLKVGDVMETDVLTVHPNTTVEDAVALGQEHKVGALPVVFGDNQLVGIVTTTDLYKITVEALGFGEKGARIHIYECNQAGRPFGEILDIIAKRGIKIRSMFHITPRGIGREDCIFHLDTEDVSDLLGELRVKGYQAESRPPVQARYCNIMVRSEWG